MRLVSLALGLIILSGCAQAPAENDLSTSTTDGGQLRPPETNKVFACAPEQRCYEPTVAADAQGRLFVSDSGSQRISVSDDGGRSWAPGTPPPLPTDGRAADILLQTAPQGRLYWSALILARAHTQYVPAGIQVAWSDDGAATWVGNVHLPLEPRSGPVALADRQWLGFGPNGVIYMAYNQIPSGIWLSSSADEGRTWSGWQRVAALEDRRAIGQSGPPVVTPSGAVLVPACVGTLVSPDPTSARVVTRIYRSVDRGVTFTSHDIEAGCTWFPVLATGGVDVVVLTTQSRTGKLTIHKSVDEGKTFLLPETLAGNSTSSAWPVVTERGTAVAWFDRAGTPNLFLSESNEAGAWTARLVSSPSEPAGGGAPPTDFSHMVPVSGDGYALAWARQDGVRFAHVGVVLD